MDLFAARHRQNRSAVEPLAVRMRPRTLEEFVGQGHIIGGGKLLRRALDADRLTSALFCGPPGTGKTTLARIITDRSRAHFEPVHAAACGVKEVRDVLRAARERLETGGERTILFVDELHRFNRAQQDVLLDDVENGVVILIGATTENPSFAVNAPLVSRSHVFQFEPLAADVIRLLLHRAIADRERGLGAYGARLTEAAADHLATMCEGDARRALNALEVAVLSQVDDGGEGRPIVVDEGVAAESIQRKAICYDATGDAHYDAISALIKSMRGGDPDAAVYWLAVMLQAGEDPRFIARRIVISAAEDVGNADPMALVLAESAAAATDRVGMPECQLPLAQAAIYLACAEKSRASAVAVSSAMEDVRSKRTIPVPRPLRAAIPHGNTPAFDTTGGSGSGAAEGDPRRGGAEQTYFGVEKLYYTPTDHGAESLIRKRLSRRRATEGGVGPRET